MSAGEGDFSFTCHVAQQMVTLLSCSGSPLPELTPLTWGWGGREGGWRRMAPVGGGGGGRGRRKEGRANQPAGWWVSLWGFPVRAPSPAAAEAKTATAAAAAAGDSTFKMAPAGLASDVTRRRSRRLGGGGGERPRGLQATPPSCRALDPPPASPPPRLCRAPACEAGSFLRFLPSARCWNRSAAGPHLRTLSQDLAQCRNLERPQLSS